MHINVFALVSSGKWKEIVSLSLLIFFYRFTSHNEQILILQFKTLIKEKDVKN